MTISNNVIINNKEYEELYNKDKINSEYIGNVTTKVKEIAENVLWDMLFTSADDYLYCSYTVDFSEKIITVGIKLEIDFFMKHFGRLVPDLFLKEIIKLRINIKRDMIKVNWMELILEGKEKRDWNKVY